MPNRADCSRFRGEFFTGEFFRSMNELRVLAVAHLSDLSLGNPGNLGLSGYLPAYEPGMPKHPVDS
jgi:hypothetical protein